MAERNYYVIRDDGCKFPAMTKQQIYALLDETISSGHLPTDYQSGGFVTQIKEKNRNTDLSFWVGTQAEYNALDPKPQNTFCIITDDNSRDEIVTRIEELMKKVNKLDQLRPNACSMQLCDSFAAGMQSVNLHQKKWDFVNSYQGGNNIIEIIPNTAPTGVTTYSLEFKKSVNAFVSGIVAISPPTDITDKILNVELTLKSQNKDGKRKIAFAAETINYSKSGTGYFTIIIPPTLFSFNIDDYLIFTVSLNGIVSTKATILSGDTKLQFLFLNE